MSDEKGATAGRAVGSLTPEEKRALVARLLKEKLEGDATFPLSHGQRALWVLYRMAPDSTAYNVAFGAVVHSPVDVAVLRRALDALVRRHEILRIVVSDEGETPVQRVGSGVVALEEIEASSWTEAELRTRLSESYLRPFDLQRGPVFRTSLYRRGPAEHVLLLAAHHIVVDAWSIGLMVSEWLTLYEALKEGRPEPLVPLLSRYADFVRWQEHLVSGAAGEEMLAYWRRQLRGPLPTIQLPTDRSRPPISPFEEASVHSGWKRT